jgi:hypothetical protein
MRGSAPILCRIASYRFQWLASSIATLDGDSAHHYSTRLAVEPVALYAAPARPNESPDRISLLRAANSSGLAIGNLTVSRSLELIEQNPIRQYDGELHITNTRASRRCFRRYPRLDLRCSSGGETAKVGRWR